MRYKLTISYDGTDFHGWQIQKDHRTIQGEVEYAINKIFRTTVRIVGSGRTDSGVHAIGQVAHVDIETDMDAPKISDAINTNLTSEIRIESIDEVDANFHARYSAKAKIYRYQITKHYQPFKRNYYWHITWDLNRDLIENAAEIMTGTHDFTFLAGNLEGRSPICSIKMINLTNEANEIIINVEGDRFLRQMARRLVGLMVDVGRTKRSLDEVRTLIGKRKELSYQIAPPQGLYLVEVIY